MKIIIISDTHGKHRELTLAEGDLIIHGGDFCDNGSEEDMHDFLDWYSNLDYEHKILIAGNHDFFADKHPNEFRNLLPREITYLNDSGCTINGVKFWGSPVQPDLLKWAFGRHRGPQINRHWKMIPEDINILVTHTPPFSILDKTRQGKSIGCEYLKRKIDTLDLTAHIFGHVHASYGETEIGGVKFINASNLKSYSDPLNDPILLEV